MENTEEMKKEEADVIRAKLREEILDQLETIGSLNPGSKELETTVSCVDKLYRLELEEKKNDREVERENTEKKKLKESIEARKVADNHRFIDFFLKYGSEMILFGSKLIFNSIWYKRGFIFEEKGVFTSKTFNEMRHNNVK